jgi:hypothetical protein
MQKAVAHIGVATARLKRRQGDDTGADTNRFAMDLEERITKAEEYFRGLQPPTKAAYQVSDGEVLRREDSLVVTMGGMLVLHIFNHELLAPPDDDAFWRMLKSTWDRQLENWERRRRRDTPRVKHGSAGQRLGGRRSWGNR